MTAKKKQDEEKKPAKEVDPFIAKVQKSMEGMLDNPNVADKDKIALYGNIVKFLQVKHKLEGGGDDGGEWFGADD